MRNTLGFFDLFLPLYWILKLKLHGTDDKRNLLENKRNKNKTQTIGERERMDYTENSSHYWQKQVHIYLFFFYYHGSSFLIKRFTATIVMLTSTSTRESSLSLSLSSSRLCPFHFTQIS